MGLSPQDILGLSIFEYLSAIDAFMIRNHDGDKKLAESEKDELWEWLQES